MNRQDFIITSNNDFRYYGGEIRKREYQHIRVLFFSNYIHGHLYKYITTRKRTHLKIYSHYYYYPNLNDRFLDLLLRKWYISK